MAAGPAAGRRKLEEEVVAATFKVLVLGNSDVGKTSLIHRYTTGEMQRNLLPTIGIDFSDVMVSVRGTRVKLRIWDTAGQEKFHTFTKQFFRGTQGILLLYDITSLFSFQMLKKWLRTIQDEGLDGVTVVLVGNKSDLDEERQVPVENAEKLAIGHGYQYMETSAHEGMNVHRVFLRLAEMLLQDHDIFMPGAEYISSTAPPMEEMGIYDQSFQLDKYTEQTTKQRRCCGNQS